MSTLVLDANDHARLAHNSHAKNISFEASFLFFVLDNLVFCA